MDRRKWANRGRAYPAVENVVRLTPRRKKDEPNTVLPRSQLVWIVEQVLENIEEIRRKRGA